MDRHLRLVLDDDLELLPPSGEAYAAWQVALREAAQGNTPPRVLLAAHGGLVSQAAGEDFAARVRTLDPAGWTVTFITRTGLDETLDQLTGTHLFTALVAGVRQLLALYRRTSPLAFFPAGPGSAPLRLDGAARAREERLLAALEGLVARPPAGEPPAVQALARHWQAHPQELRTAVRQAARETGLRLGQRTWEAVRPRLEARLGQTPGPVTLEAREWQAALALTAATAADPNALEAYAVEEVIRTVFPPPRLVWAQMKARMARLVAPGAVGAGLLAFLNGLPPLRVSLVGHSLGGLLLDHLERVAATLAPLRERVEGVVYLAPANTLAFARETPRLPRAGYALMGLTDAEERDEVGQGDPLLGNLYPRTVLYLISNALEDERNTPVLGMQRYLSADPFRRRFGVITWVPTPGIGHVTHTGFLKDPAVRAWIRARLGYGAG